MNQDIIFEAEFFLSSFFQGMIILFLYDGIRIFRKVKKHMWVTIAAEDCLFWGIAGIFVFHMVYEKNYGIIRAYAACAMGVGMCFYYFFISTWYVDALVKMIHKILKMISRFVHIITKPLRIVFYRIDARIGKISSFLKRHLDKYAIRLKKPLKNKYNQYKIERATKKIVEPPKKESQLERIEK